MPRKPRPHVAGGVYHVNSRGNRRSVIFRDDGDHVLFLSIFLRVVEVFEWDLHGWCQMTTHYHGLFTTRLPNLGRGMQRLNSLYADAFNARYGLSGHVFQGRYWHRMIEDDDDLAGVYRYIARNPVRAGICTRADDWPWSSYTGLVRGWEGRAYQSRALLDYFAARGGMRGLRAFVELAR